MPQAAPLPVAADIVCGTVRLLTDLGFACITEMTLANGRRADIVALGRDGEIMITEVKSSSADYRSDSKWGEYLPYCDRFFFAVSSAFPTALIDSQTGLIIADRFGGAQVREAPATKLPTARRKAMTLRFARLAAMRAAGPLLA